MVRGGVLDKSFFLFSFSSVGFDEAFDMTARVGVGVGVGRF